jgi:hypothetical protein
VEATAVLAVGLQFPAELLLPLNLDQLFLLDVMHLMGLRKLMIALMLIQVLTKRLPFHGHHQHQATSQPTC